MKILIAANDSYGLYIFRRDLIQKLIKEGNEVYALLPDGECTERIKELGCHFIEVPVDRRGISPKNDIKLFLTYLKHMLAIRPKMVITYTIKPNVYCGLAARLLHIPYAVNITGLGTAFQKEGLVKEVVKLLYRVGCGSAKVVFTENPGNKETLCELGLFPPEKVYVLHGAGVNTEHYAFEDYPAESEPLKFLFIGRIMQEKGIDEFFRAADRLINDGLNAEFHMAGGYDENEYQEVIDQRTKDPHFVYEGWLDDIRPAIKNCHCFVLPSWHEGMANTLLECGSMGRPITTSNIHGCLEAVEEGKNGFLHEVKNADSLYETMKKFAALSKEEKAAMGKYSREYIVSNFDKKQVVEETVTELYKRVKQK